MAYRSTIPTKGPANVCGELMVDCINYERQKMQPNGNMDLMNRIHNSSNPHQGRFRRTLTVCSAGLLRSPTTAFILSLPPYNRNVRAVGSHRNFALTPIDEAFIAWADEIVFVNKENHLLTKQTFDLDGATIYVLNVPDIYQFRDPRLIEAIKQELKSVGFPEDHNVVGSITPDGEAVKNFKGQIT